MCNDWMRRGRSRKRRKAGEDRKSKLENRNWTRGRPESLPLFFCSARKLKSARVGSRTGNKVWRSQKVRTDVSLWTRRILFLSLVPTVCVRAGLSCAPGSPLLLCCRERIKVRAGFQEEGGRYRTMAITDYGLLITDYWLPASPR